MLQQNLLRFARNNSKSSEKLLHGRHLGDVTGKKYHFIKYRDDMAESIEPYQFEPLLDIDDLEASSEETVGNEEENNSLEVSVEVRRGHNHWCSCGRYPIMTTERESVCCKEIREVLNKMASSACITIHPNFETVCLNEEVLETALVAMFETRLDLYEQPCQSRTLRQAAYRQFTWWVHRKLGRAVRRVIPACAVFKIRTTYPELSGEYTGFQEYNEGLQSIVHSDN